MVQKNDLYDYKDQYIFQDDKFFKFSLDSILLGEYASCIKDNEKVLEMCCGNLAVSLVIANYSQASIVGFEITPVIFELAKKSILINNRTNQISVINDDVNNLGNYYSAEAFDSIVCNPPYFKVDDTSYVNDILEKRIARHEVCLNLEQIFSLSTKYLKNKGKLFMVHRADRLDEIIELGSKYNLRVKNVQLISTKKGDAPMLVLIKCVKGSKQGVKFAHELCIENMKSFQRIFKEGK